MQDKVPIFFEKGEKGGKGGVKGGRGGRAKDGEKGERGEREGEDRGWWKIVENFLRHNYRCVTEKFVFLHV
ncbi:MAG: hypothetical protein II345_01255 [Alistipes sp.]|nr:hypothetical protein [Alistipes sp.]